MTPDFADERTLVALDFVSVRERVVAATHTQRGRALAVQMEPSSDFAAVRVAQQRTAATRDLVASDELSILRAIDTSELTQAAALGRTLAPVELRSIGDAIAAAAAAYRAVRERAELGDVIARYTPLRELHDAIANAIDERGSVLDRASPALGRIRRSQAQAQTDARDRVAAILRSSRYAKAIQDNVVTIREGRFVIPIKAEFAGSLPGIVHDTSSTGQTLFVEPLAALEANNRLRTLRIEEEREVQRILDDLSRRIGSSAGPIETNVEMLASIDLLAAKATVAQRMDAIAPELNDEPALAIERGRHPLLGERAIPQSLALDDTTRLVVISGPNMGGKTVALKMVGLFVVMTYCGMQIPASTGTRIGCFDRVVADIGDEQSIVANASTFSAHLQRMREMLDRADHRTLVIIDEIGGGTEPTAGAALAIAMLERLLTRGARGVVTTHATELKLFAHATPGVVNASVRFDPQSFKPTFQLDVGSPGQSLAFPLAHSLGIDEPIVERAQELLDTRERDYETALAELSLRNAELQREREDLERTRRSAEREAETLASERTELETQRRTFGARAEERLAQTLRDFSRELQRRAEEQFANEAQHPRRRGARVSSGQAALLGRTIEAIHQDLGLRPAAQEAGEQTGTLQPDDRVEVLSLHQRGTVVEDYGDRVLVAVGPMKTVVRKDDIRRDRTARRERPRAQTAAGEARVAAATRTMAELDVRGKRYVEAEPLVERWVDEALLAGNSPLRLIHGKGTGMLGRGLQEYLRAHPAVEGVRYGNEDEGSSGVSIIDLRSG